jgi:amino acid transporter
LGVSDLVGATLLAVFIYWGWDTAVACNEETTDPEKTPGRAALISTVLLLVTYALVATAAVAFAGTGTKGIGLGNPDNGDDIFNALGPAVFGHTAVGKFFEVLLIISVLTSASASTQTTIMPTARTSLSMGAYRAIPRSFAKIHPRYLTPSVSTIWMGILSIVFYVGLTLVSQNVLGDSIASVGLMIAFYYGITGFACVWFYRKELTGSARALWMRGVLPGLGGLLLLAAFVKSAYDYSKPDAGSTTLGGIGGVFLIGIGTLVLGAVLMVVYSFLAPAFFRGRTLLRGTPDLVLSGTRRDPLFGLPDSGDQAVVIAPDLSNEPESVPPEEIDHGR